MFFFNNSHISFVSGTLLDRKCDEHPPSYSTIERSAGILAGQKRKRNEGGFSGLHSPAHSLYMGQQQPPPPSFSNTQPLNYHPYHSPTSQYSQPHSQVNPPISHQNPAHLHIPRSCQQQQPKTFKIGLTGLQTLSREPYTTKDFVTIGGQRSPSGVKKGYVNCVV